MNLGMLVIISLIGLSILGVPIGFALGLGTMAAILYGDLPTMVLPQKMFTGCDSMPLLAIPFFLLAGNVMSRGITQRILTFSNALLGSVQGGLAAVTVVASSIFAAISGSGVATVSAIGGMTIPAMKQEGYDPSFAAAVSSVASILGPIIPPSIFLIVYGSVTETSIGQLFMAAVIPGLMVSLGLVGYVLFYAKKRNFPKHERVDLKTFGAIALDCSWALFMPVLILGGIFGGIFTATEAAAVSVVYALLVCLFIYKGLTWRELPQILFDSAITTSTIMVLLALSKASSWIVVTSKLPLTVVNMFSAFTDSAVVILLLLNGLLLVVGMLMEGNAAIVMLSPLIMPLLKTYGISPIHFGVVLALNLCIGLVTPPVGVCLLLGNEIAGSKFDRTLAAALPMIGLSLFVLALVTYVPAFTGWLPSLMY